MAVEKKPIIPPAAIIKQMGETAVEHVAKHWKRHAKELIQVMEESEKPVIVMNLAVTIDFSESTPMLTTGCRFTKTFTDEITDKFDDPKQLGLGNIQQESSSKGSSGRKSTESEQD